MFWTCKKEDGLFSKVLSFSHYKRRVTLSLHVTLLHNLIRNYMPIQQDKSTYEDEEEALHNVGSETEYITHVIALDSWTSFKNNLVLTSFNDC